MIIKLTAAGAFTALAGLFWLGGDLHEQSAIDAGAVVVTVAQQESTTPTTATTTTTTTTTTVLPYVYPPAPTGARCPQWWTLAQQAGFTYDQLEHALDLIMWRESRCRPDVRSGTADSGLLQINDMHLDWLADHGITADMLFDPWWNLIAGRMVADLAESYGWRWTQPWTATFP